MRGALAASVPVADVAVIGRPIDAAIELTEAEVSEVIAALRQSNPPGVTA